MHFLLKDFQGRKYIFAVNSVNQEITTTFSGFYDEAEQLESDTLTVLFEDREVIIRKGHSPTNSIRMMYIFMHKSTKDRKFEFEDNYLNTKIEHCNTSIKKSIFP